MTLTEKEKELIAEFRETFRYISWVTLSPYLEEAVENFVLKAYRTGREEGINEMKDKIANTIVTSDWDNDLDGVINKFSSLSKEDDIERNQKGNIYERSKKCWNCRSLQDRRAIKRFRKEHRIK